MLAVAAAIGLAISLVAAASALRRLLLMHSPNIHVSAKVVAILPVTGAAPQLAELVRRLSAQTVRLSELIIAVESAEDPAHREALALASDVPTRVLVAGEATDQAQKCRNQQAALRALPAETEYIVFLDADVEPEPDWLRTLLSPLVSGGFDLVTGHRWQVPVEPRVGAHVSAAIDRAVTLLPRPAFGFACAPWGGSMAMSHATARRLGLPDILSGVISDDLTIGVQAARAGLRVATRSALLVRSPISYGLGDAWRFGRRQYQMCRIYRPFLWWIALLIVSLRLAGWLAAVALGISGVTWITATIIIGLNSAKQMMVVASGVRSVRKEDLYVKIFQISIGIFQPLVDAFHVSVILTAFWTRSVRWGHVTYGVRGPHRVRVRERRLFSI